MMSILDLSFPVHYFLLIKGIASIFSIFIIISFRIINELKQKNMAKEFKIENNFFLKPICT